MTMTPDAGTYQRLAAALTAHRGDVAAYQRLGAQMKARRHLLDPRYGNRQLFVRERLIPLGLKESAAKKLAYDLEHGTLQSRGGFSAGSMLILAQAYGTTPDSLITVLDGGELEPLPADSPPPPPAAAPPSRERTLPTLAAAMTAPGIEDYLATVNDEREGAAGPREDLDELRIWATPKLSEHEKRVLIAFRRLTWDAAIRSSQQSGGLVRACSAGR